MGGGTNDSLEQHRLLQEQEDIARKNLGSVSAAGLKLEQVLCLAKQNIYIFSTN
jgi:hypothetical protein